MNRPAWRCPEILALVGFLFLCRSAAAAGVHFDHPRGLCDAPFELKLKASPSGTPIRYTLDGSEPSATNGLRYVSPILVTNTTVVRAKADGGTGDEPDIETRTFLFPTGVLTQSGSGLPTAWGTVDGKTLPVAYGIHPPGDASSREQLLRALRALPSISIALAPGELFGSARGIYTHTQESGDAWERAASVEFLPIDGSKGFHLDCGVRIQGGWSRRPEESPKHSLRLVFNKRFGTSHLKYPLYGSDTDSFSTLILRGGNNNTWLHPESVERQRAEYLRDAWMRKTYGAMGHPTARDRFVHVYLNGLYWGIYDLTERPDAHFAALHLGGSDKDYDSRNSDKVLSGDDIEWKKLFAAANAGVGDPAQYAYVSGQLDLPAFIDYMILNLYGANGDIDRGSNWYSARRNNPPQPLLFLVWDGERTLEGPEDDRMTMDDDECPTRLFQKLRTYPDFRRAFAERAKLHLTGPGVLSPVSAAARYKALADLLEPAIPAEAARWGAYRHDLHQYRSGPYEIYTRDGFWRPEVQRQLTEYFPRRPAAIIGQFKAAGLWGE